MPGLREDIPVLSPARPCEKMLISFSMGPEEIRVQTHLTGLQHICHELVTVMSYLKFLNCKIKPISP